MSTVKKIKVLYIDDELNNLNGFKATFRFDYTIFLAQGAAQAYEFLIAHPDISIVLSDQRMPDKTGVQFFEEMREQYPNPIRMLITGYTDIESVIDAVNKGHIFRYIKKPWTDVDIKTAIDEASKFYDTSNMLAAKNKELQYVNDELSKFTYSITHDMRGPLVSVLGALELAKGMDSLPELRDLLLMAEGAVKKLDEYIRNMHEYYKIKNSSLEYEHVDFKKVVEDLAGLFQITGRMDNVQFLTRVYQEEQFTSDLISLKIILNNLLSNAFKYQKRNNTNKFVDLNIEVKDNRVTILVKDNGIGIHDHQIDRIFTLFYRATSEEVGSGFGLYNVKDAIIKLNGTIEVNSKLDEGTIFKVIIPGK